MLCDLSHLPIRAHAGVRDGMAAAEDSLRPPRSRTLLMGAVLPTYLIAADQCVWLGGRVLGQSTLWIRKPWPSAAAGGRVEGGADPAVVGGVEGEAGGDDLVDAVEDVVGEVHVGSGEL
jgi:hypothetical protein